MSLSFIAYCEMYAAIAEDIASVLRKDRVRNTVVHRVIRDIVKENTGQDIECPPPEPEPEVFVRSTEFDDIREVGDEIDF